MAMVKSLQKAIEYMEDHLLDDITIEDISKQAYLSPYHFQRTFVILTDMTVGEYLRRRRLTKAAQELCNGDIKIIDLAYKYGYSTPESFSKAFHKQHGLTPSEARKGTGNIQSYNRLTIQVKLKGAEPMNYQLLEREAFKIVGVKQAINCNEEFSQSKEIGQFWGQASRDGKIHILADLKKGQISGLIGATVDYSKENNQIEYWIGAESIGDIPNGLSSYEIPAAKWAIFKVVGPVAEVLPKTWHKIYSEWFPSNDYENSGGPALEVYNSPDPTSPTAESEIWVPVK